MRTAVNAGSELLIFVPGTAHSHDLSLSFVAGRPASISSSEIVVTAGVDGTWTPIEWAAVQQILRIIACMPTVMVMQSFGSTSPMVCRISCNIPNSLMAGVTPSVVNWSFAQFTCLGGPPAGSGTS